MLLVTNSRKLLTPWIVHAFEFLKQWNRREHITTPTLSAEDELERQGARTRAKKLTMKELLQLISDVS
jgi:hypothetical protein